MSEASSFERLLLAMGRAEVVRPYGEPEVGINWVCDCGGGWKWVVRDGVRQMECADGEAPWAEDVLLPGKRLALGDGVMLSCGTENGGRGEWVWTGGAWACASGLPPVVVVDAANVRRIYDAFVAAVKVQMIKGGVLFIRGFGIWFVGTRAARTGWVPQEGGGRRQVLIHAKRAAKFRAAGKHRWPVV